MLIPAPLLRSCLRLTDHDGPAAEANLRRLMADMELEGVDGYLVGHLGTILDDTQHVPTLAQVRDWCLRQEALADGRASAALARLEGLDAIELLPVTDFVYQLAAFREDLTREELSTALLEASTIMSTGLQVQQRRPDGRYEPKVIHGATAAAEVLMTRVNRLGRLSKVGAIDGEVRGDLQRFQREVVRRAARGEGILTGIESIDRVHHGMQPGQLVFVLGFTGHYKSTMCFNWAYRAAVYQQRNVGVVSLEMSAHAFLTALTLMHCSHPQFEEEREKLGVGAVTAETLRTNGFRPQQRKFFERVMHDLETGDYGRIYYREAQASITVHDIQRWAEKLHRETPLDMILIDYLGLVDLGPGKVGQEQSSYLNQVVRQTKIMANSFAGGRGITVLSPFQANRDGYKEAEKNSGRYKLTAMAWASEAEKSADLVYSTYLDDGLRAANELVVGSLKARDSEVLTDLVKVFCDPKTRRIEGLGMGADSIGGESLDL
jgi:hypothetical protein